MSKCKKCGEEVVWKEKPGGGFFPPENPNGSRHDCQKKATAAKPGPGAIVGLLDSYSEGSATFRVRGGILKTYAITKEIYRDWKTAGFLQPPEVHADIWLEFNIDVKSFVQPGYKRVQQPSWVVVNQPATPVSGTKRAEPAKETCTSPTAAPERKPDPAPAAKKDEWSDEREEFYQLLKSTGREGMPELLQYLEKETDFFIAPSSTKYHDARDGGLLHHSLKTYHNLVKLYFTFDLDIPVDSLVIIGLLHDVCKANFYKTSARNVKQDGVWVQVPYIDIEDQFPLGHGEKSAIILLRYIKLTDTEIMAIRWHMMAYDDIRCSYAGNLAITNACSKHPIIVLTHIADLSASFLEVRAPAEVKAEGA